MLEYANALLMATRMGGALLQRRYDQKAIDRTIKRQERATKLRAEDRHAQLREILSTEGTKAGQYNLFDPVAIRIVERSKIPTVIFNGNDISNLKKAFNNEKIGTRILHDTKG